MSERQSIPIRMWRADARQPWGFRLQGGADFGQPLTVQKVRRSSFVLFSFFFSNTFASKKNLSPPPPAHSLLKESVNGKRKKIIFFYLRRMTSSSISSSMVTLTGDGRECGGDAGPLRRRRPGATRRRRPADAAPQGGPRSHRRRRQPLPVVRPQVTGTIIDIRSLYIDIETRPTLHSIRSVPIVGYRSNLFFLLELSLNDDFISILPSHRSCEWKSNWTH